MVISFQTIHYLSFMDYVLLKYAHFFGIILVVGGVFAELWMLKNHMTREEIKVISKVDGLYGLGSILVVVAGLTLWLSDIGKPPEFYSGTGLVYWKLGIFSLVGLLSIYPTVFFAKEKLGKKHSEAQEMVQVPGNMKWVVRLEFLLLLLMPLIAAFMAQGISIF